MNIRTSIFTNLIWRFMERCGAQLVTLIVSIILARILNPEVYGIIALVTVIITILQVFVDGGLATSLIQKKDADDIDFSTVFYFNIFSSFLLYIVVFLIAPLIANFYNMMELTLIIRVLSLMLVVAGVKNVQQAYVSRNMLFKKFFFSTLGGTVGAAFVGIVLAYLEYGVWALVFQMLFNIVVDTIILWITVKWRPKIIFSIERLNKLFSFGWKMLMANLIATINGQLKQLVIGKIYSSTDLAYYNRGRQFPDIIVANINTSIDSVLFPALSNEQEDYIKVREMTRRSIKVSTYIMAPLMIGLFVCADSFVKLILTDKWIPCVPFMRIFTIIFFFYPIHTANLNAIKAMGRSNILLKLEIVKDVFGIVILFGTMKYGTIAIAYGMLISSLFSQVVNSWPNRKLLEYKYINQILDIVPNIIIAIIMGGSIYFIKFLDYGDLLTLFLQISVGAILYIALSVLSKNDSFKYLVSILNQIKLKMRFKN